jgi:hypothetical protein
MCILSMDKNIYCSQICIFLRSDFLQLLFHHLYQIVEFDHNVLLSIQVNNNIEKDSPQ